jgi:hypothetical protein
MGLYNIGSLMIQKIVVVNILLCGVLFAQNAASSSSTGRKASPSSPSAQAPTAPVIPDVTTPENALPQRYRQNRVATKARQYYALIWGIDSLAVKSVESGEMIRFTYRVVDPEKAKTLNDKKNEPSLIDPRAGVKLVVPALEKVGKLRQSSTPQAGKVYWMAFSNKGGYVKPGHRVNVEIGQFRASGLVVQ